MKFENQELDGRSIHVPAKCVVQDPFAELVVRPATAGGQEIPRKALFLKAPDKAGEIVEHYVWAHSEAYKPVSNAKVMALGEQIVEASDVTFGLPTICWDGKRFIAQFISEHQEDVAVGDTVALGLHVQNSYNTSLTFGVRFFAYRLACSNGMYIPQFLEGFAFKHVNGSSEALVADAVRRLGTASVRFEELMPVFAGMAEIPADLSMLSRWVQALDEGVPRYPRAQIATVAGEFTSNQSPTVWDLYNAFTYALSNEASPFTAVDVSARVSGLALQEISRFDKSEAQDIVEPGEGPNVEALDEKEPATKIE